MHRQSQEADIQQFTALRITVALKRLDVLFRMKPAAHKRAAFYAMFDDGADVVGQFVGLSIASAVRRLEKAVGRAKVKLLQKGFAKLVSRVESAKLQRQLASEREKTQKEVASQLSQKLQRIKAVTRSNETKSNLLEANSSKVQDQERRFKELLGEEERRKGEVAEEKKQELTVGGQSKGREDVREFTRKFEELLRVEQARLLQH